MHRLALAVVTLLQAVPAAAQADEKPRPKRPTLNVRATPRMAFSPVTVFVTAELVGGDDVEEYYCPEVEWQWGDGGKSVQESDCPPFEAGVSRIGRRFTGEHRFRRPGYYSVTVALRRADRIIARADVKVTVRSGLNDPRP